MDVYKALTIKFLSRVEILCGGPKPKKTEQLSSWAQSSQNQNFLEKRGNTSLNNKF